MGNEQGTRAVATVLVPVFSRYPDAQVPFDRVTATWTAAGLTMSGRAMGLDLWTADDPAPHGVASADVRGTARGVVSLRAGRVGVGRDGGVVGASCPARGSCAVLCESGAATARVRAPSRR